MKEEIHEALIALGFEKSGKYYKRNGDSIKVYPSSTLQEIFKQLIAFGYTQKEWEVKRALGI